MSWSVRRIPRVPVRFAAVTVALASAVLGLTAPVQASPATADPAGTPTAARPANVTIPPFVGGPITRQNIINRAQYWVDQQVPYDRTAYRGDLHGRPYRTDSGGLVSMAWRLGTSATPRTLPHHSTRLGGVDELQPGDALSNGMGRAAVFVEWTDALRTSATVIELAGPGTVAHRTQYSANLITLGRFKPYRFNRVIEIPVVIPDKGMTNITPAGDLNGDGAPDVIAVETATGDLYRYSGPSYGGGTRVKIGHGWTSISDIAGVGDLTGDGVSDILAVEAGTGDLYRYSGPGFGGSTRVQIGHGWDSMAQVTAVGDQTGDGAPDVIAIERSTGDLYRYAGPGYGGSTRAKIGHGWNIYDTVVGVGDQTGDGIADILAVHAQTGELFRHSGPGYGGATKVKLGDGWDAMINLAGIGDLTGDGVPDLLAVEAATQKLFRYSGPGFEENTRVQIGTNW
ncbi:VCBS repeat-containing protein [Streptomyces uncialis]|uniref:FG-GAP repeat domain-containing protein n=1 Tax=Streptomyces uncialis TaxID=1048205 RepID=UPI00224FD3C9|nr:VCBS repeat-containing protein [Streptomyces uncialis]MCX4657942.1 VCBS repeat-containing protein [Streptomyces uncialis]